MFDYEERRPEQSRQRPSVENKGKKTMSKTVEPSPRTLQSKPLSPSAQYSLQCFMAPGESMRGLDERSAAAFAQEGAAVVERNETGIPDDMKERFENLSGFSFDDVRVHYNSDKPAQLQALAYTQGNQVFVGPGQEKHLPHELGHVVQQKQGIVKPTSTLDGVPINTSEALEHQADNFDGITGRPGRSHAQFAQRSESITVQGRFLDIQGNTMAPEEGSYFIRQYFSIIEGMAEKVRKIKDNNFRLKLPSNKSVTDNASTLVQDILGFIKENENILTIINNDSEANYPFITKLIEVNVSFRTLIQTFKDNPISGKSDDLQPVHWLDDELQDTNNATVSPALINILNRFQEAQLDFSDIPPQPLAEESIDLLEDKRLGNSGTLKADGREYDARAVGGWKDADQIMRNAVQAAKKSLEPPQAVTLCELLKSMNEKIAISEPTKGQLRSSDVAIKGLKTVQPLDLINSIYPIMKTVSIQIGRMMKLTDIGEKRNIAVTLAGVAYKTLISIHPFQDGNGRTCRMFSDYILMLGDLPPANHKDLADGYVNISGTESLDAGAFYNRTESYFQGVRESLDIVNTIEKPSTE